MLIKFSQTRLLRVTVMEELKNAGIDVSPERLQAIMNSQNDFFGGDKQNGGKKE